MCVCVLDGIGAGGSFSSSRRRRFVRGEKYNGYGVYEWPNGDKYMGDWRDNERCGRGVFLAR